MKRGRQKPTFSVIGEYAYSYGKEVVAMFEEDGGATFYPAQKLELETMLARKEDGSPAALTVGISKPRQNGKSYSARFYAVYMADFEHRNVLYSAHHSTTTNKMFKAICELFENPERFPEFAQDVKYISHVRGYEGIYFKDYVDEEGNVHPGGCIEFATRTNSGARGGTYSVIIIDEAQELTDEQLEAMLPVISAANNVQDATKMPQQIYIGTPPNATCRGTVFARMHKAAHSKAESLNWWLEWSVEAKNSSAAVQDKEQAVKLAYMTNPAMGYRIAEDTVINEFENMSADGFLRERLGWWCPVAERDINFAIDHEKWAACRSDEMKPEGKTAYGVKFSMDGSMVCLAGAVIADNGVARISIIEYKSTSHGQQWLADWLNERYKTAACVVVDGRNGVDVLIDKIADTWKAKKSIIRPSAKDMIASVGCITEAINDQSLTWYSKQELLNVSATTSVKRSISGGWGFGGENAGPIEACALALWGAKNSKRNPNKAMRIG